jgi:hypothetical protein
VPLTHELRVIAPAGARILLDGVAVGAGEWRSMTVRPGDHRVSAIVKTVDDCPSARQDVRARVERSGTTDVRLAPRPCGYLALDAEPRGGRYVVRSAAGADVASGALPHDAPLILPTGDYTLQVSAKFCADYRGAFTVTPGETHRERVRLICR